MRLEKRNKIFFIGTALVLAPICGVIGCARAMERRSFPAMWPAGLDWSREVTQASVAPAEPAGPAVAVEPFVLDAEGAHGPSSGPGSTSSALTNLMVEKLWQAGVRVSSSGAEYAFTGTISKLGYTQLSGYPRKLYYTSELVYRLARRPDGAVVWEGKLSQDFEQTVLVNTMTKLPDDPNAPERVLLEKCISPNWAMIAADVKAFLKERS